jgi:hypothetical protein
MTIVLAMTLGAVCIGAAVAFLRSMRDFNVPTM